MCKNVALEAGPLAGLQKLVNLMAAAAAGTTNWGQVGSSAHHQVGLQLWHTKPSPQGPKRFAQRSSIHPFIL